MTCTRTKGQHGVIRLDVLAEHAGRRAGRTPVLVDDGSDDCALSDILATSPYNLANSRIMMAIEYARRDFIFLLVLYYLAFI